MRLTSAPQEREIGNSELAVAKGETKMRHAWDQSSSDAKKGLLFFVLGFVFPISYTGPVPWNTESWIHLDLGPVLFGALAVACGYKCVRSGKRWPQHRRLDFRAAGILAVFGVVHVLRALNVVGGPF